MSSKAKLISPESCVLAAICTLDLATTIFWIGCQDATEGNPVMNYYLETAGTLGFVAAKMVLCCLPLFIVEWARRTHPGFARSALRCGIAGYVVLYAIGVAHFNSPAYLAQAEADALAAITTPYPVHVSWDGQ